MAYFFTWQPHGNQVSKTRFITLINLKEEPLEHQRTLEKNPEEKKKQKQNWEDRDPGHATRQHATQAMPRQALIRSFSIRSESQSFFLCCFLVAVKALNEIKASLGWRVVYVWVGDNPCGDGDLPPWSSVTCSTQGDYRFVTELYDSFFVSFGIFTIWWILFKFLECDCFFLIVLGLGILSPSDLIVLGLRLLHFWIS